jgi:anti-sigma factor RsiW
MTRRREIQPEELHAFIDGELDEPARTDVETALEHDVALADMVELYRADKSRIAEIYGKDSNGKLPRRWIALIERETRRTPWDRVAIPAMAIAASFMLVFGLTVAFQQTGVPVNADIVTEALAARTNEIGPQTVIAVRSQVDAQVQDAAMSQALATRIKAPDLSALGYRLVAIETYDAPAHSFELVYRDGAARVLTVYLRRSSGVRPFNEFVENGLRVCIWQDGVMGTVMAGKMSAAEMERLAAVTYERLTL